MMRERLVQWADYFAAAGLALWVAAGVLLIRGGAPTQLLIGLLVAGVLLIGIFVYAKFALVKAVVTSRSARYGSNSLFVSVLFIFIVGILAFLSGRYVYRYDTTANQSFTLSSMTTQVMQGLNQPINAILFFTPQSGAQQRDAEERMKLYKSLNPDKFNYKFVDPDAENQMAFDYNVQVDGTIVFERGNRRENVFQADEQSLTNAIFKVSQDTQPTVYFTTGHGERGIDDTGDSGFSSLKDGLANLNYKLQLLDLKTVTETLPADITALVIAGPVAPFDPKEVQKVQDYIANNGHAIILLDPGMQTGLDALLASYGVTVRNDLVYDPRFGLFGRAQIPVINTFATHAVTQKLNGQSLVFPGARSLTTAAAVISYTVTPLFATSDASWGETDFDSIKSQTAKYDAGKDTQGPLTLGYAIEGQGANPARLVVIGNSAALVNANLRPVTTSTGQQVQFSNGGLFLNSLRWFTGQENLISIPNKSATPSQVTLTGDQSNFVFISSVFLLPALILLIGAVVWWRRR